LKHWVKDARSILQKRGLKGTQEEIARASGNRLLADFKGFNFDFSTWDAEENRPEGYGSKDFHGNCSPTIIYGLLLKYAPENSVVFDPMAGSGTFVDVAHAMGYQNVLAYDIHRFRDDITEKDAEQTNLDNESIDFVFAHFPYWKLIQYTESNVSDLSRLSYNEFIIKTENVFREMHRILKKGKFFAVMIGNMRENGVIDLESDFSVIGRKYFRLWDKIVKKIRTWEGKGGERMRLAVARARARDSTVINHDTILVFRKD